MATKKTPRKNTTAAAAVTMPEAMPDVIHYRGNVPLKSFLGWIVLIVLAMGSVGLLVAQLLVGMRQAQLIEDTAARVNIQGQGRASTIHEWIDGEVRVADNVAQAEIVQLYLAEVAKNGQAVATHDGPVTTMGGALRAQAPYMKKMVDDVAKNNGFSALHLLLTDGQPVVSYGPVPEAAATGIARVVAQTGQGQILPLRMSDGVVVLDIVRPVGGTDGNPISGVLWLTVPAGEKLAALVAPNPEDRAGERTALVQVLDNKASVVGKTGLSQLGSSYNDLQTSLQNGHALSLSVVDAVATFAALLPVSGTPFQVLQEYRATEALSIMAMYKPGIYTIVGLGVIVLSAFMLALTLHLMAQRNRARVKLLGQTTDALVRGVEARDPHLFGHHARLSRLVIQVSNTMGASVGERATLFYAAQMAAVGRLLVPRPMMAKSKLSPAERKSMQSDISRSVSVLEGIDFDLPILPVIQQMYERIDGSGHPGKLKGAQISRMGRIIGLCDAYVALTSPRSYREAMKPAKALEVLDNPGFDSDALEALRKVV
ncbi:MAG TPA: HD domain-containing phosphohydrolase [Alphaproteobacteria bacterium]|nr:HD domain-containing phosphohydrolase [Alphaproteobacteria bacterium]